MSRGQLIQDNQGYPIQKAALVSTLDGTGTPQQSPITVGTGTEVEIVMPDFCAEIIVHSDQDIWIDSVTGVDNAQGFILKADVYLKISVEPASSLFAIADSAEATVSVLYQSLQAG